VTTVCASRAVEATCGAFPETAGIWAPSLENSRRVHSVASHISSLQEKAMLDILTLQPGAPIVIFGCNHRAQLATPEVAEEGSILHVFRGRLADLVAKHSIQFIGEETNQRVKSFAEEFADKNGIVYSNIDIPLKVQGSIEHRRQEEYDDLNNIVINLLKTCRYAKAWNLVREYHMGQTFLRESNGLSSLLICGDLHANPLKEMFEKQGRHVTVTPACS
jgi:hypothetical protein